MFQVFCDFLSNCIECICLHPPEVLGALVSVMVIWILTGVLVYEGVLRVIHQDYEIDADIMLITAAVGVYVNVL